MAKKKKTKKKNLGLSLTMILLAIAILGFSWIFRYEFFPQLIKDGIEVHFLTKNGEDKIVKYPYNSANGTRFKCAITELIKGPSTIQKILNTYSEIPVGTQIIAVIESKDKNIIDLTSEFNTGAGTESIYSKLSQLINTVESNTEIPTYLFINGAQIEVFGGEGIMITQPLSKESLQ